MLRQFVAGFMLVIFMTQTFSNALIVADYYINTASFAANCINKSRPELHCNGQCQMAKQLDTENKKNQSNPDRKAENKIEAIYSKNLFAFIDFSIQEKDVYYPSYASGRPVHRAASIFHPPCVA